MSTLTDAQMQTISQLLDRRETEVRAEVRAAREAAAERPSAQGPQVEDLGEAGEQRIRVGIEHAELERDQQELREIEDTRERIANGTYGQCIDCGRDIPFERLKAQPTAKRCIACQSAWEKTHPTGPRYSG
jgi:RNA polymerase-binding protein DksA